MCEACLSFPEVEALSLDGGELVTTKYLNACDRFLGHLRKREHLPQYLVAFTRKIGGPGWPCAHLSDYSRFE